MNNYCAHFLQTTGMLLAARIALLVAAIFALAASFATAHNRPVIGILAQPKWSMDKERTYIAASYVKWVEAAGARVVPIPYNVSHKAAEELLSQINGKLEGSVNSFISPSRLDFTITIF